MILDLKKNPEDAALYDVLDAETGENINHECIFYADDETGNYKVYQSNLAGRLLVDVATNEIKTETRLRKLRISPRQSAFPAVEKLLFDGLRANVDFPVTLLKPAEQA